MSGFTEEQFTRALAGDLTALNAVPKAEFHTHLLLSAPLGAYPPLEGVAPKAAPALFPSFTDFDGFLVREIFPRIRSPQNMALVVRAALHEMVQTGVVYAESSVDMFSAPLAGVSWEELAETIESEIRRFTNRLSITLDLGLSRGAKERPWPQVMKQALDTGLFKGVDLYGEEAAGEVAEFSALFDAARSRGLRLKLHTGEQSHGQRALEECNLVTPNSIQHGITAASLEPFVSMVLQGRIPLHVCPTSNVRLGAARSYETHPIRELFDSGVTVTINTDDISVFGQNLSQEYLHLYRVGLFDVSELEEIRLAGLRLAGLE